MSARGAKMVAGAAKRKQRAKQWFLTYADCPLPKEVLLKYLEAKGLDEYVICEEIAPTTGKPHLHAYVKLKEKIYFKQDYFDIDDLGNHYHPNFSSVRNYDDAVAYAKKCGNYISNVDIDARKQHRSKLTPEDYDKDPLDLLADGKIGFMQLNNFLKNQDVYRMLKNKRERAPEKRPEKRRHIWIYGESNTGKTVFREKMMNTVPGGWFQIPLTNDDWKGYNGELNLYADEYKGQKTIQMLNMMCDGGAKMNTKGGTTQLNWCCKIWIFSNYEINTCYSKTDMVLLDSLHNRFNEIEFKRSDCWKEEDIGKDYEDWLAKMDKD